MQKKHHKPQLEFQSFRKLDQKTKLKLIKQASQEQKHRRDNPQGTHKFLEQDFINFQVYQGKHKLSLKTYRHYKGKDMSGAIGVVFMFHGLNSYIGHGAHIAVALGEVGFITVGFDHRGFGRSPGEKAYVESLESHIYDALSFTKKVKEMYPGLPAFALGLSMGGMTSYYLTLRYKDLFKGAILMAPAIKNIIDGMLVTVVSGMSSLFGNKFKLPVVPPRGQATRNPKITEDVYSDPYAYTDKPCLKTIKMLTSTMQVTPKTFPEYDASFVIIQGGLDKLVHPDGAFQLYDKCKSKDKSLWFYEQMWHDIWHEEEIFEIIEKLKVWLVERVGGGKEGIKRGEVEIMQEEYVPRKVNGEVEYEKVETVTEIKSRKEFEGVRENIDKNVHGEMEFNKFNGGFDGVVHREEKKEEKEEEKYKEVKMNGQGQAVNGFNEFSGGMKTMEDELQRLIDKY